MGWKSTAINAIAIASTGLLWFSFRPVPPAQAQGYPGYPGYPSPGWSALKRTDPAPSGVPADYDWTGLTLISTWLDYQYNPGSEGPFITFGGGGAFTQPVGGYGGKCAAAVDLSGTSTWKWLWTPPTDPTTGQQATLTQAPAQPLWILPKINGGV